jgi:hypothetical protein
MDPVGVREAANISKGDYAAYVNINSPHRFVANAGGAIGAIWIVADYHV